MLLFLVPFKAYKTNRLISCDGNRYKALIKRRKLFAVVMLIFYCLCSLQPRAQLNPFYLFKFDKINTGVKPFNQTVLCMAQDSIGFMWFGTANGLYQYDGSSFKRFGFEWLNNIEIRSLLVDSKKNMWIAATWEQLFKYDVYHNTLTRYIYDTAALGQNASQAYKMCEGNSSTLWLASAKGIITLNTVTGKFHYYSKEAARSVCLYNDTIWVGMATGGIKCFDARTNKPLETPAQWRFLGNPNYTVTYLYSGSNNNLWVGTNLGLFLQDSNGVIKTFYNASKSSNVLPDNSIDGICDEQGTGFTYICTPGGMGMYEEGESRFTLVQNNIDAYAVTVNQKPAVSIMRDVSGKIWAGTDGAGIFSFYPRKIKVYRHSLLDATSIHSNEVKRVFLFNNNLLAAVYRDGIDLINLTTNACNFYPFYNTANPTFNTIQYPSEKDGHSIFIGGRVGLFVFDIYSHTYTPVLPAKYNSALNYVQAARYDANNNLWIGCEQDKGGLYRYNTQTGALQEYKTGEKGLLSSNINFITQDDEGSMVVCNYMSVQKYVKGVDSFICLNQNKEILFASAGISYQNGANGISFAGMHQNGIFFINKNLEVLGTIDETNGLGSNTVLSMLPEGPDALWACTGWGINKIIFTSADRKKYTLTHIDNTDGLPGEMVINMVAKETRGEKTYFLSTADGLVQAKASALAPNTYKPPVVITSIVINDTVISPFDSSHILSMPVYLTNAVHLSHTQNSFLVNFASLNYINAQKNRYAYKLEGVDKDWTYTSHDYSPTYSNLRPGTYTFLVKASNDAGVWNNTPATLQFIITPPFWQTIWAYMLYVILIAAAVYAFYASRIKQYRLKQEMQLRTMIATQEQERKRISRDLHDDIGTKLSALKLFVSTFKNNLQKQQYAETEAMARNTEELIDETIGDVRVMLMNLSPGILEEFGYVTAVEGLVNKINDTKTIHINLVVFALKHRLGKDYELALYRITQELVNNVLKHAHAKNASLQIGYRDGKIILMIEDDGDGFDVTTHKEGYGLKNLEARTKLLQGTMSIDSLPGNGTSVLIEIPYQFN